jgi:ribosomal protein S18 acetylase RimI-like enzyme
MIEAAMPLPILNNRDVSPDDLVRLFHRTELHWARQVAEDEVTLECGVAMVTPALPRVHMANQLLDGFMPDDMSPADVVAHVDETYRAAGVRCCKWTINPSMPPERTRPLEEHLLSNGFRRETFDLMYLKGRPAGTIEEVSGLKIIPARASFRHARQLIEKIVAHWNTPELVDAMMSHYDDPHTDALLALKDGEAAAIVEVLSVGELGCIEGLDVAEHFRGQGIGRTMMSRAMEICARSLFKHVFLTVRPDNAPAIALYRKFGFEKLADFLLYRRVDAT